MRWPFLSSLLTRQTLLPDRFLHATPAGLGLESGDVAFPGAGGTTLRGWMVRDPAAPPRRGTIVLCAGNSGNVSCHLEYARMAARTGRSVLCFDYRGFGRSDGEPDLASIVPDVRAACEAADSPGNGPLALLGVSLGAGAALAAAALPDSGAAGRVHAIAVEGVSDVREMLLGILGTGSFGPLRIRRIAGPAGEGEHRERARLGRGGVPRLLAMPIAGLAAACYPFEGKRPVRLAGRLAGKSIFIIHGVEDQLLPFEAAIDLHDALGGRSRLWLIPGAGHAQEPILLAGEEYAAQLDDFISESSGEERHRAIRPAAGGVLQSAIDGATLRQGLEGAAAFPPAARPVSSLPILAPRAESGDPIYTRAGYQAAFRAMVRAANARDLTGLDGALGRHLALARAQPFDLLASLYALRAAEAGLGRVPGWRSRDRDIARRCLERVLELRRSHPFLPGEDEASSPSAWARGLLEGRRP